MITKIGQGSAEATTVTIPAGHQRGDILLIFAFLDGTTVNPTIPTGWTTITNTTDGTLCAISVGWKVCTSSADTSGTWTNATSLMVVVLRGVDNASPFATFGSSIGSTNTVTFNAITPANLREVSKWYIIGFLAHGSTDTNIDVAPPAGMTNFLSALGIVSDMCAHVATSDDTWASTNTTITGTASNWISMTIAARHARLNIQTHQGATAGVGNTGIISISEKVR